MIYLKAFALSILIYLLSACNEPAVEKSETAEIPDKLNVTVLAKVNGEPVTEEHLELLVEQSFGANKSSFIDQRIREKLLDSKIASVAMSQQMERELPAEELELIRLKSEAYRQDLLVREYLVRYAEPLPISINKIEQYYQQNPHEFGGAVYKIIEQLGQENDAAEEQRELLISSFNELKIESNWQAYASQNKNLMGLTYKKFKFTKGLLDPVIESAVESLKEGESSRIVFIDGSPSIFRVLRTEQLPAKPLHQVSSQIREKLMALELKKAMKKATETAIEKSVIELSEGA